MSADDRPVRCGTCGRPIAGNEKCRVTIDGVGPVGYTCLGCYYAPPPRPFITTEQPAKLDRAGDPRFYALLEEIAALHARKASDYSPGADPLANFRGSAEVGVRPYLGILTRLRDKWGRLCSFARGGVPLNESVRDSHIDSAVYHLLAILLLEDEAK
jgi:hypothetical protein